MFLPEGYRSQLDCYGFGLVKAFGGMLPAEVVDYRDRLKRFRETNV